MFDAAPALLNCKFTYIRTSHGEALRSLTAPQNPSAVIAKSEHRLATGTPKHRRVRSKPSSTVAGMVIAEVGEMDLEELEMYYPLPSQVFYERYSFIPRRHVDLSSWACSLQMDDLSTMIEHLSAKCKHLSLNGIHQMGSAEAFRRIFERCKNLERLDMAECSGVSKTMFKIIASLVPRLQSLNVSLSFDVTDDLVRTFGMHFKDLMEIDLSYCEHVTDAGILIFSQHVFQSNNLRFV